MIQGARFSGWRFRVQDSRLRVQGFRVGGLGSRVRGSRFEVEGARFRVEAKDGLQKWHVVHYSRFEHCTLLTIRILYTIHYSNTIHYLLFCSRSNPPIKTVPC